MRMMSSFISLQRGWISLPIIMLLLVLSTLSMQYQQRLQASYQWRGQLKDIESEQQVWTDFKQGFVVSPDFSSATLSACLGFCGLGGSVQEKTWQKEAQSIHYQWLRYEAAVDESVSVVISYRLCASQNRQQYRCWWWRGETLFSQGWVSAAD